MTPPETAMNHVTPEDIRITLATLVERMSSLASGQAGMKDQLTEMKADLRGVQEGINGVPELISSQLKNYVTLEQYRPVKEIVEGAVQKIMWAVLAAILALVLIKTRTP